MINAIIKISLPFLIFIVSMLSSMIHSSRTDYNLHLDKRVNDGSYYCFLNSTKNGIRCDICEISRTNEGYKIETNGPKTITLSVPGKQINISYLFKVNCQVGPVNTDPIEDFNLSSDYNKIVINFQRMLKKGMIVVYTNESQSESKINRSRSSRFQIDNLKENMHYEICISVINSQEEATNYSCKSIKTVSKGPNLCKTLPTINLLEYELIALQIIRVSWSIDSNIDCIQVSVMYIKLAHKQKSFICDKLLIIGKNIKSNKHRHRQNCSYVKLVENHQINRGKVLINWTWSTIECQIYVIMADGEEHKLNSTHISQHIDLYYKHIFLINLLFGIIVLIIITCFICKSRRNANSRFSMNMVALAEKPESILHSYETSDFKKRMLAYSKRSYDVLRAEYQELNKASQVKAKNLNRTTHTASLEENINKNVSETILAYDQTRVKLTGQDLKHDYINASKIPFIHETKIECIACQGPIEGTQIDFMKLLWQEKIKLIIMLTQIEETDSFKYIQYYPDTITDLVTFNKSFTVKLESQDSLNGLLTRKLILKNLLQHESRLITHLQMPVWEEDTVPSLENFHCFLNGVQVLAKSDTGVYLVQCRDGASKTGVFIVSNRIIKEIQQGADQISIYDTILNLRSSRPGMVTTEEQYIFIHQYVDYFLGLGRKKRKTNK